MIDRLSPGELKALVLSDNESTRTQFLKEFESDIDEFSIVMSGAFNRLQSMEARTPAEMRSLRTYQFLYAAFNSLFTAFHLFISGFLVPAGNLMRQYGEAVAMALLCSHRALDVYDRIERDYDKFPIQSALDLVNRGKNRALLSIDQEGWKQFREITKFYNDHSHSSMMTLELTQMVGTLGLSLGGEYDTGKIEIYRKEVSLRVSAAMRLREAIEAAERNLINS